MPCNLTQRNDYFKEKLLGLKERHKVIEEFRGMGLLIGLKLAVGGDTLVNQCLKRGFLINCIQENILRFVPPLIITKGEIDALIECLDGLFKDLQGQD